MIKGYTVKNGFYYEKYLEKLREAFEFALLTHQLDGISYDELISWTVDIGSRLKFLRDREKEEEI